jgi:hypothetical protein
VAFVRRTRAAGRGGTETKDMTHSAVDLSCTSASRCTDTGADTDARRDRRLPVPNMA